MHQEPLCYSQLQFLSILLPNSPVRERKESMNVKITQKISIVWFMIFSIYLVVSLLIADMVGEEVFLKTDLDLSRGIIIFMSCAFFIIGSFIDVVIMAFIIHISSVILNIHIKGANSFFIASLFHMTINIHLLLKTVVLTFHNPLSISSLSQSIVLNPFFYIGLAVMAFYIMHFEKKKSFKLVTVIGIIMLYKVLAGMFVPSLS